MGNRCVRKDQDVPRTDRISRHLRSSAKALAAVLLFVGLLVLMKALGAGGFLVDLLERIRSLGAWGPLAVGLAYVPACVFLVPGSALTLGAGFLFGVVKGAIAASLGSTVGACVAFLVGRTLARSWAERQQRTHPRLAAVSDAVGREGFKVVLLTRLSPLFPFNLLNYVFGLTPVPLWRYALASWIGMFPGTLLYAYLGSGARSLADAASGNTEGSGAQRVFFWLGLLATIVATLVITRLARRALREVVEQGTNNSEERGMAPAGLASTGRPNDNEEGPPPN